MTRQRELWVDTLRIVVITGVVVMHTTTAYLGGADWFYTERTTSTFWSKGPVLVASVGALFGLAPLFLVAGLLSARSLARKGRASFVRGRLLRLGVPLVVFIYLIDPLSAWVGGLAERRSRSLVSYLDVWEAEAGPMWFVAALLVFSLVYAALHRAHGTAGRGAPVGGRVLAAAVATIALAGALIWLRWPLDAEDTWLNLRWGMWPQGAVLFALGVRVAHSGGIGQLPPSLVRRLGWIAGPALAVLVALAAVVVAWDEPDGANAGWLFAALAVFYGTISVAATCWLVVHARNWWTARSRVLTAAGRASYATYVLHPLVLTAIMVGAAPIAASPEAKCVAVGVVAVPACFVVGWVITRVPGLSRLV
jgi:peptidoglycan/LPS O-acetylase OafA/YrhL